MRPLLAEKSSLTLSLLAMAITTARLLRDWTQALELAQSRFEPWMLGFQSDPLRRFRAASMPRKSGFVNEGSWPKTVLSRVPPVLPSATSNKVVMSAHVKPAFICAAKNSSRRLTSTKKIISDFRKNKQNERRRTDVVNIYRFLIATDGP